VQALFKLLQRRNKKLAIKVAKLCHASFYKTFDVRGHEVDVFKNPTASEYKEIRESLPLEEQDDRRSVRFGADADTQQFIVWSSMWGTHHDILTKIFSRTKIQDESFALGYAYIKGRRLVASFILSWDDTFDPDYEEWQWLKDYMDISQAKTLGWRELY